MTHLQEINKAPYRNPDQTGPASENGREENRGIWSGLKERTNPYLRCPQKNPSILVSKLTDGKTPHYVIKNPQKKTYFRLSGSEYGVLERMDGVTSVQDLIMEYYLQHGKFAHRMILNLVDQLHRASMLVPLPVSIWTQVKSRLHAKSWSNRLSMPARWLLTKKISLKGIDRLIGWLYRHFFRFFFTRPAQIFFLLVSSFGLLAFFQIIENPENIFWDSNLAAGMGLWWLAAILPIVIHELGHALTVKHYGREVPRGGLMLFFGLPAAYVETTDIWMEPRRARLAVTWNGPYTGLIIGGMASLLITAFPSATLNSFLLKMASVAYASVFFNVNPLLKYDGYYLLVDALDIPNLREKSLAFIKNRLLRADFRLKNFSRTEWIYSIYGILTILWMGYAMFLATFFWKTRLGAGLAAFMGEGYSILARIVGGLMVAGFLSLLVLIGLRIVGVLRALSKRLYQSGIFTHFYRLALFLPLLAAVISYVAYRILPDRSANLVLALLTGFVGGLVMRLGNAYSRSHRQITLLSFGCAMIFFSAWHILPDLDVLLWLGGILLITGGFFLDSHLIPFRDGVVAPLVAGGITVLLLFGMGMSLNDPTFWLIPFISMMGIRSFLAVYRSARSPAVLFLFGGSVLVCMSQFYPGLAALSNILIAGGGLHLVLARLPPLHTSEVEEVSVTHLVIGGSMDVIVRRLVSQIYFESGLPGVVRMAQDFSKRMRQNNLELAIQGIRFVDPGLANRSPGEITDVYGLALDVLYVYMGDEIGKRITQNTFASGMDLLPWQNREVISEMIFSRRFWGMSLHQGIRDMGSYFREMLKQVPLFVTLPDDALDEIAHRLVEEKFGADEVVITEGEPGDKFYIVSNGKVAVLQKDFMGQPKLVEYLRRGQFFGEQALVSDQPRNATVQTVTPATIFSMKRMAFNELVRHYVSVNNNLNRGAKHSWLLRGMPIFDGLESQELDWLSLQMDVEYYRKGDVVFREGDAGRHFYLVESGRLAVTKSVDSKMIEISKRGPGEYFGEVALLRDCPRTATLTAETDIVLLSLAAPFFQELLFGYEGIAKTIERTGSRRAKFIEQSIRRVKAG